MTRQELIQELMEDSQTYCCYCGTPKVRFSCCGENHFETFAEMNKETQESILSDMASEVSDFWEGYVPEPVKPAQDVVTNLTPTYAFFQPPKPVGAWVLDPGGVVQTQLVMHRKPTDEQIKNTEAMFGWKWKDLL